LLKIRKFILLESSVKDQLEKIKQLLGEHDAQRKSIDGAMENLQDEKPRGENGITTRRLDVK